MQNKKKLVKQEKGAISTLVLFTVLVFLAILMGSYLITTTLLKSQLKSNMRIAQIYGEDVDNVDEIYEELALPEVAESKEIYFNKETILEDSSGNRIVVPKGFKIAKDSGDNVTEGIVIEDEDIQLDGNGKERGNQYVWIPVSNINRDESNPIKKSNEEGKTENIEITLGRYTFDSNGKETLVQKAEEYEDETLINTYQELKTYREGVANQDLTALNRTAKDLKGFIDSVEANGGYYIARYEASYGTDKKPNSKVSINQNDTTNVPTKEGTLWNNVTQIDAAKVCYDIYTTVQSDLINSYAWDTAIVYIQKFSENSKYSTQSSKNTALANTGQNNDQVCKINDMASNCGEVTTEYCIGKDSSLAYSFSFRGGKCGFSDRGSSFRGSGSATGIASNLSTFRPILYISIH